jgi:hypothetical protein
MNGTYELPYKGKYAIVSANYKYDAYTIETVIRNPTDSEFRDDFELSSRFYISKGHGHAYGGELEASAYSFSLRNLESAAKVLKKVYKKSETITKKFGYTKSATENIIRSLIASGVPEVRIAPPNATFNGWDHVRPLSLKKDISTIRERLAIIEEEGFNKIK